MKKISFTLLVLLLSTSFVVLSQNNGGISTKQLEKFKQFHKQTNSNKAITNALSNNDIKKLALNRSNVGKTDHNFKYKVDVKGITNQKSSGRCWMFTGLNVLRPKVMKQYNLDKFEFSTNYLYFYDLLEKSNLYLEQIIKSAKEPMDDKLVDWLFSSPVGDGGVWNSLTNLVEKYGLVPKEAMPETYASENTSMMVRLIRRKLREDGIELRNLINSKGSSEKIKQRKTEMLAEVYHILAINLSEPPSEFNWRYKDKDGKLSDTKTYTPLSFLHESLPGLDFTNYVMLMNDPSRPYYKLYEIDLDRNVIEGRNWHYINLPADDIKEFALASIKENEAMYLSCDVGKQLNKDEGILSIDNYDYESLYNVKFGMNKSQRIISHESGSTHGMALVGVDVDNNETPVKWLVENSWGSKAGHNGYITITDEWFNEYMFRVVVLKKYVSPKILKILKQEPTILPPWDPMFSSDL